MESFVPSSHPPPPPPPLPPLPPPPPYALQPLLPYALPLPLIDNVMATPYVQDLPRINVSQKDWCPTRRSYNGKCEVVAATNEGWNGPDYWCPATYALDYTVLAGWRWTEFPSNSDQNLPIGASIGSVFINYSRDSPVSWDATDVHCPVITMSQLKWFQSGQIAQGFCELVVTPAEGTDHLPAYSCPGRFTLSFYPLTGWMEVYGTASENLPMDDKNVSVVTDPNAPVASHDKNMPQSASDAPAVASQNKNMPQSASDAPVALKDKNMHQPASNGLPFSQFLYEIERTQSYSYFPPSLKQNPSNSAGSDNHTGQKDSTTVPKSVTISPRPIVTPPTTGTGRATQQSVSTDSSHKNSNLSKSFQDGNFQASQTIKSAHDHISRLIDEMHDLSTLITFKYLDASPFLLKRDIDALVNVVKTVSTAIQKADKPTFDQLGSILDSKDHSSYIITSMTRRASIFTLEKDRHGSLKILLIGRYSFEISLDDWLIVYKLNAGQSILTNDSIYNLQLQPLGNFERLPKPEDLSSKAKVAEDKQLVADDAECVQGSVQITLNSDDHASDWEHVA